MEMGKWNGETSSKSLAARQVRKNSPLHRSSDPGSRRLDLLQTKLTANPVDTRNEKRRDVRKTQIFSNRSRKSNMRGGFSQYRNIFKEIFFLFL